MGVLHAVLEFDRIVVPATFQLYLVDGVRILVVRLDQYGRTDVGGVREVRGVTARPKARRIGQVVAAGDDDTHRVGVGAVPIANVRIQTGLVAGIELGDGVVGVEHVRGMGGRIPFHVEAKGV